MKWNACRISAFPHLRDLICLLALVSLPASHALAGDATDGYTVELFPNLTTVSVIVTLQGDDNSNAAAAIRCREAGGAWQDVHPGVRIHSGRLASSIFRLAEQTVHEVEVTLTDPDGAPATPWIGQTATRRAPDSASGGGTEYFVAPDGDDGDTGGPLDPFATVAHAVATAGPGDTVTVRDGVYREAVEIDSLDAGSDPLTIRAVTAGGAVLDGSDETLSENPTGDLWTPEGSGIYSTPLAVDAGYVSSDGAQLYRYNTLLELQSASAGVHEGYYWDGAALHVRLHDDDDPDGHQMAVGVREAAFSVWYSSGVIIDGFEIRYYGTAPYPKGIYLRSSSDCVVRNNEIHHTRAPVSIRPTDAHRNLIEGNHIWDTGITDWPWDAVKGSYHESSAVAACGGEGNVVRGNEIHGLFNGIYVGSFSNDWDETESPYTDVHGNHIYDIPDDPLEPKGACLQSRFFDNRVENALMGISLAPINVGPVWIFRNTFWRTRSSGMKINNSPVGPMQVYHNTFYTDLPSTNCVTTGESGWSHLSLRNNILYGTRYVFEDCHTPGPGNDWDRDLLYTTAYPSQFVKWNNVRYYSLAELQAGTGQEMNGAAQEDPLFADPAAGDLQLTAGSPAVDRGMVIPGISGEYAGAAPDLGAFEYGAPAKAIAATLTCLPAAGTVPFSTEMTVTLSNLLDDQPRRAAGRIDAELAGGPVVSGWRAGWTNLAPSESFDYSWTQSIPALGSVIGENRFLLAGEDVTPPPFNQPPYVPSGGTAAGQCTITGSAP